MPEFDATLPVVYIHPGESHLVRKPTILRTLLGSCVGITFLIPRLRIGALCHPMLPTYPLTPPPGLIPGSGHRYVDFAIHDLTHQFDALGAHRSEVQVKLFGGGDVLMVQSENSRPTVGKLNIEVALKVLEEVGFTVIASSLGGVRGVNIIFNTETGEVLLQRHT